MLALIRNASRRCIAFVLAMALVFALAPGLSMAYAVPEGAFLSFVVHAHAHGGEDQAHHGHHHPGHKYSDHDAHHGHDTARDDGAGEEGKDHPHVHYDASLPNVLPTPEPVTSLPRPIAVQIAIPPVEAAQGAPPSGLLRPPIPAV